MANLQSIKSGVAFWYGPMKSWPGGGSPNSTHKNTTYRLDKLRSALVEAQLKNVLSTHRATSWILNLIEDGLNSGLLRLCSHSCNTLTYCGYFVHI